MARFREDALETLLAGRNAQGGWGYRARTATATEPTAVALMALAATGADEAVRVGARDALLAHQSDDGGFVAAAGHSVNGWATGLALAALVRAVRDAERPAAAAATWLVDTSVYTLPKEAAAAYGYDTTLTGWAWTEEAFSFTEPTAFALIGLKQSAERAHPRVAQGEALLRDRVTPDGGWNYGEPRVLERDLPAQEAPTAAALLALQNRQDATTDAALDWLAGQAASLGASLTLGYVANALRAKRQADAVPDGLLEQRWRAVPGARRGMLETALLLLAVCPREKNALIFES